MMGNAVPAAQPRHSVNSFHSLYTQNTSKGQYSETDGLSIKYLFFFLLLNIIIIGVVDDDNDEDTRVF